MAGLLENVLIERCKNGAAAAFGQLIKLYRKQLFSYLLKYYGNYEITKAVLTVTLTMDIGSSGSYCATEVHKEMLGYLGIADKKLVELAINKLLRYYTDLNYGKEIKSPKIKLQKKETVVIESENRDKILSEIGVKFTKEYFRKRYNLADTDFEISRQPSAINGQ
ncbi:MAG: DUF935 domain-containing protein [Bacteroidetes bacterium]|nr:DUF935 domain-containing protein [Bacteroidota bacterium]